MAITAPVLFDGSPLLLPFRHLSHILTPAYWLFAARVRDSTLYELLVQLHLD